jgi:hypothetical protein
MTDKKVPDVPDGMQKIYQRFERWRSSHQGRLPIPPALWASAAEVAREHGVFRTATILRRPHPSSGEPHRRRSSWSWSRPRRRVGTRSVECVI